MKRIIFNIALISTLVAFVSCKKDPQTYKGDPQLAFDYPGVNAWSSPTAWMGTATSIHGISYSVTSAGRSIDYPVTLIADGVQKDIPFAISILDPNSVTGAPAISTIDLDALTFAATGTMPTGRFNTTFNISVDHSKLSSVSSENVIYLLLSPVGGSAQAAENYRRVKLTFVKN